MGSIFTRPLSIGIHVRRLLCYSLTQPRSRRLLRAARIQHARLLPTRIADMHSSIFCMSRGYAFSQERKFTTRAGTAPTLDLLVRPSHVDHFVRVHSTWRSD